MRNQDVHFQFMGSMKESFYLFFKLDMMFVVMDCDRIVVGFAWTQALYLFFVVVSGMWGSVSRSRSTLVVGCCFLSIQHAIVDRRF